jgi:hypothetical protein
MECENDINTIEEFISIIKNDTKAWNIPKFLNSWFRGQPDINYELIPSLFRKENKEIAAREHNFNSLFRRKAPGFGETPEKERYDEWLFLMQHAGFPTRLLDWTESPLVALYFSLYNAKDNDSVVWMLNPLELNYRSIGQRVLPSPQDKTLSYNFKSIFNGEPIFGDYPIALLPGCVNSRMQAQRSCFTLHGINNTSFENMFNDILIKEGFLKKYIIKKSRHNELRNDLRLLGIEHASLFPDFEGLSQELKNCMR